MNSPSWIICCSRIKLMCFVLGFFSSSFSSDAYKKFQKWLLTNFKLLMSVKKHERKWGLLWNTTPSALMNVFGLWAEQTSPEGGRQPSGKQRSHCYLGGPPLPRPRPGPGPAPLGPGGLLTGLWVLGLGDASATSFSRLTPLPGFVLVGFGSGSAFFSVYIRKS